MSITLVITKKKDKQLTVPFGMSCFNDENNSNVRNTMYVMLSLKKKGMSIRKINIFADQIKKEPIT